MPIFEFACKDCDSSFEKLVRSFSAPTNVVCPQCGSTHVQKQMSAFAARVQGGTTGSAAASSASSCSPGGT